LRAPHQKKKESHASQKKKKKERWRRRGRRRRTRSIDLRASSAVASEGWRMESDRRRGDGGEGWRTAVTMAADNKERKSKLVP
jgi:hypothetical protein